MRSHWDNGRLLRHSADSTADLGSITSAGDFTIASTRIHSGNINRVRIDVDLGAVRAPIALEVLDRGYVLVILHIWSGTRTLFD